MNNYDNAIAIIGMDLNMPGCRETEEFWNILLHAVECIENIPDGVGATDDIGGQEHYVGRMSLCRDYDKFDAGFFGYSNHEAKVMDPQHRLFLQSCWKAVEHAGYRVSELEGNTGVYGSAGYNTYLIQAIMNQKNYLDKKGYYDVLLGNDKDYMATRVSYKLGLTGPSMTVQSACSSSLAGVHLACQSLLMGEADMCLAGGVCVRVPGEQGYVYQEGFILSADGHCRPFDAQGTGTVFGSGVGVVVLKRLEDAMAAKDHIYSVIRSSAVNNDGNRKIGFTAPSFEGQTDVTQTALGLENIEAASIRFIEAHGTGTTLGDPIELNSIINTFGLASAEENQKYPCAIGSVKSNIGHLDTAAGIAGLIKASLCLYHRKIVPTLHFAELNPKASFKNTRFYVADKAEDIGAAEYPARAAVSAFGVGGTNVSIILEEPPRQPQASAEQNMYPVILSAKTEQALFAMADKVKQFKSNVSFGALAYTLASGREEFAWRMYLIYKKEPGSADFQLVRESPASHRIKSAPETEKPWSFLITKEEQYQDWEELYQSSPVYREILDQWIVGLDKKNGLGPVLQIAMAETLRVYCRQISFRDRDLTAYLSRAISKEALLERWATNPLKCDADNESETIAEISMLALYEVLGQAWSEGLRVDWQALFPEAEQARVSAPTYQFDKTRYWYEEEPALVWRLEKKKLPPPLTFFTGNYLIFGQDAKEQAAVADKVAELGLHNPGRNDPVRLVFLLYTDKISSMQDLFYECLKKIRHYYQNIADHGNISALFVQIRGYDQEAYIRSMLLDGLVNTLPKELPNVHIKQIICEELSDSVIREITYSDLVEPEIKIWVKGNERFGLSFVKDEDTGSKRLIKDAGTYIITGGTGNVGLMLAGEIAGRVKADIILISQHYNEEAIFSGTDEKCLVMQSMINKMRARQNKVEIIKEDVAAPQSWSRQLKALNKKYGQINGIIHAAGKVGKAYDYADRISPQVIEDYMGAKVNGAWEIIKVFQDSDLDFCILVSSTAALFGGIGDAVYSGANAILNEIGDADIHEGRAVFAIMLDYMPRLFRDDFVVEEDGKVKNLLAAQLSREDFSTACERIFNNTSGQNLVITKTDPEQRYQKEKDIRKVLPVPAEKPAHHQQRVMSRIQDIWNRILESDCDVTKNFFDVGGDSYLAVRLTSELNREFALKLPTQFIYEFPTIRYMTQYLNQEIKASGSAEPVITPSTVNTKKEAVYVVGMAGRFPDADSIDELWDNLLKKKKSIRHFKQDESGNEFAAAPDGRVNKYIGARSIINNVDEFDYQFFGLSRLEAELMDPQQRIFIETAWQALEDSGCVNILEDITAGVFASQGISTYLTNVLVKNNALKRDYNNLAIINNSPDALATRVSYLFNLSGISKTVQTFCSSSLVALEEAVTHIEAAQCDLAIVGGVNIVVPQCSGYIYNESAIYSPSGEVRPFDDAADGTVFGNGAGVVVLAGESLVRELSLHTYAEIIGRAVNNDGSQKAGFLSPSVKGQSECIRAAYQAAGIKPSEVVFIETHGTATNTGDPIEVHALKRVFAKEEQHQAHCALGSIKGNIGHLDRAAGITGFIKACLVAEKHCIPPLAGFTALNRNIDLTDSPFYINQEAVALDKDSRLCMGVSALGVGGTNAHVVIRSTENENTAGKKAVRRKSIIPISAQCEESLILEKQRLARFLQQEEVTPDKLAYVRQLHRKHYPVRAAITAKSCQDLIEGLERRTEQTQTGKINTILCTGQLSDQSLANVIRGLIKEEKWLALMVRKKFGASEDEAARDLFAGRERMIFEYCLKSGLPDLLAERVIILLGNEEDFRNIAEDDRTIHLRLSETDRSLDALTMTPADTSAFSHVIALLWQSGIDVNWKKYNLQNQQETIHLPAYAFRKSKCWVGIEP